MLVPGVAFDHPSGGGPLIPRLTHVNALWVVSSTGAPWWVTRLYMGDPVRRQIARGIKPLVSRKASFRMLTLYDMDRKTEQRAGAFRGAHRTGSYLKGLADGQESTDQLSGPIRIAKMSGAMAKLGASYLRRDVLAPLLIQHEEWRDERSGRVFRDERCAGSVDDRDYVGGQNSQEHAENCEQCERYPRA